MNKQSFSVLIMLIACIIPTIIHCDTKILTWNYQGTSNGEKTNKLYDFLKKNNDIDVILIQEAGDPTYILDRLSAADRQSGGTSRWGIVNFGTDRNPLKYFVHYWTADFTTAYQQKLFCMVKSEYVDQLKNYPPPTIDPPSKGLRPFVGIETDITINGVSIDVIYNVHAPSGNHNTAAGVSKAMIKHIDSNNWFVFGDFNAEPNDFGVIDYHIIDPQQPTRQDAKLDYGICKLPYTIIDISVGDLVGNPDDHKSVLFTFEE